ncbi:hypothetical protein D3C78_1298390 [compost metagenome]
MPGTDIIIPHNGVTCTSHIERRLKMNCITYIIDHTGRIQSLDVCFYFMNITHRLGGLSVQLITYSPCDNTRMMIVPRDHFKELLLYQWNGFITWLCWLLPQRYLFLHQNSVTITPLQQLLALLPVKTRKYAVSLLQLPKNTFDIINRFCHSGIRVRTRHPFYTC